MSFRHVGVHCLEFALLNSLYQDIIIKPKQVLCLESVYMQNDVICVLPTGYGKSLIFHLLPMLLFAKFKLRGDLLRDWRLDGICTTVVNSIVIVVSPLNSLMSNQISRLNVSGIRASVIKIKEGRKGLASHDADTDELDEVTVDIDFIQCEEEKLRDWHYQIVFAHPGDFNFQQIWAGVVVEQTISRKSGCHCYR